jgi:superfamily II DNA or RNA helicase
MKMILEIANQAWLFPLSAVPCGVVVRILDRLTFSNPAYLEAEKRGFWTGKIAREITGYSLDGDALVMPPTEYSQVLSELTRNADRNDLIAADVAREAGNGAGVCLVLTDRKAHCETLAGLLAAHGLKAAVLTGDLSKRERDQVVANLSSGGVKVLVATGQLIGEGFDCRQLSTLILATPIRFNGRLVQYLGRVLRPATGKEKAKVYDYVDPVGVLENAARARQRVYG